MFKVPSYQNGQVIEVHFLYALAKDRLSVPVYNKADEPWPEGDGWTIIDYHAYAAMILLFGVIFQKQSVPLMMNAFPKWVFWHRWVGRVCLVSIGIMSWYGYEMAPLIKIAHFADTFIYLFIAPFVTFAIGLYATASPQYIHYHRLFGNMLVKGVVGTPLARMCATILQSNPNHSPLDHASDYYLGIGFVTLVLGAWQVLELVIFFWFERSGMAKVKV